MKKINKKLNNNEYYQLTLTNMLKQDIQYKNANETLSLIINNSMNTDSYLQKIHTQNGIKGYVFNELYPREKEGIYKKGKIYLLRIRSFDKKLIDKLAVAMKNTLNHYIQVVATEVIKVQNNNIINEVYTVTPVTSVINNIENKGNYWTQKDGVNLLEDRIIKNLKHKYNQFFNEELKIEKPINCIEVINKYPISIQYKNSNILAHRLKLHFESDMESQKLAFIALGTGLLEKNSCTGLGYCTCNFIEKGNK